MEQKAILNCYTKKLTFWYKGEFHEVNLSEGDLHDSWNGIMLKDGTGFDFNFSWDKEDEDYLEMLSTSNANGDYITNNANISIYTMYEDQEGEWHTNHDDYDSFNVDEFIGTNADYFNEDVTTNPNEAFKFESIKEIKF